LSPLQTANPLKAGSVLALALTAFLLGAGGAEAQNLGMGERYDELDAQAERTVTDFGVVRAISVRGADGSLVTRLETADGEELSRLAFSRKERRLRVGEARRGAGPGFEPPLSLTVTSDWANAQLYSLWRDRVQGAPLGVLASPVFDGYFFRSPSFAIGGKVAAAQHHRAVSAEIQSVRAEFPAVIAETARNPVPVAAERRPNAVHSTFTTRLFDRQTGQPIGIMQWFPEVQTLSWKLDGGGSGFIDPERLAQAHLPGWPFQPDLAWSNVQMYAFYLGHAENELRRAVGEPVSSSFQFSLGVPGAQRIAGDLSTATAALCTNQPDGCTGLHWLDDTIFRECCDEHDRCYYQDREECCTFWSWFFPWQQGWSCAECNVQVVWCFVTGGGGGGGGGFGGGGGPFNQDPCQIGWGDFCSAECSSCTRG
jgi:hypothetical protein